MDSIKKNIPYHLQVYEILREKILSGELTSGERIYENKISQELGVSRSPVREALRMLEQDELLSLTSSGLIVNPMNFEDMEEIYQCRMAVEPFAAKLAASRFNMEDIEKLKEFVKKAREYHKANHYNKIIEVNTKFHNLIVANCGNSRLKTIVEKISSLAVLSRISEFQLYQRGEEYLDEHETIIEALVSRNGDKVEKTLREHIINDLNFYKDQFSKKYPDEENSSAD